MLSVRNSLQRANPAASMLRPLRLGVLQVRNSPFALATRYSSARFAAKSFIDVSRDAAAAEEVDGEQEGFSDASEGDLEMEMAMNGLEELEGRSYLDLVADEDLETGLDHTVDGLHKQDESEAARAEAAKVQRRLLRFFMKTVPTDIPLPRTMVRRIDKLMADAEFQPTPTFKKNHPEVWDAATKMPIVYDILRRVLTEVQKRLPFYSPDSVLEFGAGTGSGTWATATVWPGRVNTYHAIESYVPAGHLTRDMAQGLGFPVIYRSKLTAGEFPAQSLVLSTYRLSEYGEDKLKEYAKILWKQTKDVLVIVERSDVEGFRAVRTVRDYLLKTYGVGSSDPKNIASAIAPCGHDLACPMGANGGICHFAQRTVHRSLPAKSPLKKIKPAPRLGGALLEEFSYVVLKKGPMNQMTSMLMDGVEVAKMTQAAERGLPPSSYLPSNALLRHVNNLTNSKALRERLDKAGLNEEVTEPNEVEVITVDDFMQQNRQGQAEEEEEELTQAEREQQQVEAEAEADRVDREKEERRAREEEEEEEEDYDEDDNLVLTPLQIQSQERLLAELYSNRYSRVLSPVIKAGRHVIMDLCNTEGELERRTVGKGVGEAGGYKAARKLKWGDLWPFARQDKVNRSQPMKMLGANGNVVDVPLLTGGEISTHVSEAFHLSSSSSLSTLPTQPRLQQANKFQLKTKRPNSADALVRVSGYAEETDKDEDEIPLTDVAESELLLREKRRAAREQERERQMREMMGEEEQTKLFEKPGDFYRDIASKQASQPMPLKMSSRAKRALLKARERGQRVQPSAVDVRHQDLKKVHVANRPVMRTWDKQVIGMDAPHNRGQSIWNMPADAPPIRAIYKGSHGRRGVIRIDDHDPRELADVELSKSGEVLGSDTRGGGLLDMMTMQPVPKGHSDTRHHPVPSFASASRQQQQAMRQADEEGGADPEEGKRARSLFGARMAAQMKHVQEMEVERVQRERQLAEQRQKEREIDMEKRAPRRRSAKGSKAK